MSQSDFVYGIHAVEALLRKNASQVLTLFVAHEREDKRVRELLKLAQQKRVDIETLPMSKLDALVPGVRHQGVAAKIEASQLSEKDLPVFIQSREQPFVLVLDGIQDPHNLGACLRTADAAGVDLVIAPKDRSAKITPAVRKVACGAAESVPFIQVTNLARTLRALKEMGLWVIGAAGEADSNLFDIDLSGPLAIVVGNEGEGMRRLTKEHCDLLVRIPMQGTVSSLNVSVATGVLLFARHSRS